MKAHGPFAAPWFALVSSSFPLRLERENYTRLEAEVALIVVTSCEGIAKSGQNVVELTRPDRDGIGDLDVQASANDEIKRVVGGRMHAGNHIARIYVSVGMSAAEHRFAKRLEFAAAKFDLRTYVVGEEIGRNGKPARQISCGAAIAFKFGLDPNEAGEKICKSCAATVEGEGTESGNVVILWVKTNVGIVP